MSKQTALSAQNTDNQPASPEQDLYATIAALNSAAEVEAFLRDLCTPQERASFTERWLIARLLNTGAKSYRDISVATGASTTTVTRVARFLKDEPFGGYRTALSRH